MKELPQNIGLRLVAFSAGIPVILLRGELGQRPVDIDLTLIFYFAPYIAIAICPIKWERFQMGLGLGYSLSMILILEIYLHTSGGLMPIMPALPPRPIAAYNVAVFLDVILLLTSAFASIWRRSQLNDFFAFALSFAGGLVYPILAFVLIAVLDQV
jgi:hypothetical protein